MEFHSRKPEPSTKQDQFDVVSARNQQQVSKRSVFITGLSADMKRKGLMEYFRSIYPSTINFTAKRLGSNKKTPGFGFLLLGREEEVRAALKRKNFYFRGRTLKAEPYLAEEDLKRHKEEVENGKVFVGKIPPGMNSQYLRKAMERAFGQVDSAHVVSNSSYKRKKRKGFGYVVFSTRALADKAIAMNKLYVETFKVSLNLERAKERTSSDKNNKDLFKTKQKNSPKNKKFSQSARRQAQRDQPQQQQKVSSLSPQYPSPKIESARDQFDPQTQPMHLKISSKSGSKNDHRFSQAFQNQPKPEFSPKNNQTKNQRKVAKNDDQAGGEISRGHRQAPPQYMAPIIPVNSPGQAKATEKRLPSRSNQNNKNTHNELARDHPFTLEASYRAKRARALQRSVRNAQKGRGLQNFGYTEITDAISKNGWKEYCLARLDHSASNIRINVGRSLRKGGWH